MLSVQPAEAVVIAWMLALARAGGDVSALATNAIAATKVAETSDARAGARRDMAASLSRARTVGRGNHLPPAAFIVASSNVTHLPLLPRSRSSVYFIAFGSDRSMVKRIFI